MNHIYHSSNERLALSIFDFSFFSIFGALFLEYTVLKRSLTPVFYVKTIFFGTQLQRGKVTISKKNNHFWCIIYVIPRFRDWHANLRFLLFFSIFLEPFFGVYSSKKVLYTSFLPQNCVFRHSTTVRKSYHFQEKTTILDESYVIPRFVDWHCQSLNRRMTYESWEMVLFSWKW